MKTYVMVASKRVRFLECSVQVNGVRIEQLSRLDYLGSWITSEGRSYLDIKSRISKAKTTFMV